MIDAGATTWLQKAITRDGLDIVERKPDNTLVINHKSGGTFSVATLGLKEIILPTHINPIIAQLEKPDFIVNVPSKTIWSGAAINMIHNANAAFGTVGDLVKASQGEDVGQYRNKEYSFFERAFRQHTHVQTVTRIYDAVFEAHRYAGDSVVIALIEAYNMSSEDLRNARDRYGLFDIALKTTSYGSITDAAHETAESLGIQATTLGGLMRTLRA